MTKILSREEEALAESYLEVNSELLFHYVVLKDIKTSSTEIRDKVFRKESIKGLVEDEVEKDVILEWE